MYRKLLISIVLSIFIVIAVWLSVQLDLPNIMIDNYIMKPINSELDIELTKPFEQNNYQTTLSTPVIDIEGQTTIPSKVELRLNNIFIKKTETDSQGNFRFEGISLRPGNNDIDVTANTQIEWRKLEDSIGKSINLEFETPSTPMIFPLPSKINSPSLIINGKADPGMDILVVVEDNDRSQKHQQNIKTDEKGQFKTEIKLSNPGNYRITAQAQNSAKKLSKSSPTVSLTYDPTWFPSKEIPMTRNLTLSLSPDNLQLDIEVILPTDDLSASGLVTGGTTLGQFIARSFDYLKINNEYIIGFFHEVTPIISITPADKENSISLTTVQASASLRSPTIKQGKLEKIELEKAGTDFLETIATDKLILMVDGYQMKSFSQVPDVLTDKKAIWKGRRQSIDIISVEVARDSLRSSTKKLNRWLNVLRTSPSDLISYPFSSLISLLLNILFVIPIVWLIRFSKQQTGMAQEVYQKILSKGLTICFVPSIIRIIFPITFLLINLLLVVIRKGNYFNFSRIVFHSTFLDDGFFQIVSALLIWLVLPILIRLLVSLVNRFLRYFNQNSISSEICQIFYKSLDDACKLSVLVVLLTPHTNIRIFNQIIVTIWGVIYLNRVWNWFKYIYEEQVKACSLWVYKFQLLIFILGVILVYPFDNYSSSTSGYTTLIYVNIIFERFSQLIPYLALLGILLFLKEKDTGERNIVRTVITVCKIFFTCYLVGTTENWFMIPIPFLLALRLFPRFVLVKSQMQQKLEQIKVELFQTEKRRELMSTLLSQLNPTKLSQALEKAENKVIAGELSIDDFRAKKTKIEQYIAEYNDRITLENGLSAEDIVLTFGPNQSNWENGLWAVKHGVWLIIPLLLIFLSGLPEQIVSEEVYIPLTVSIQLVTFLANWLLYSFFFGYFFSYIRGVSGVKKGLRISIVIVICLFPIKLISFANPTALVLWAGQIILFFTILGLWAFDYHTSKKVLREQFTCRKLFEFADLPTSTAFVSVLLASVGAATSSVLTGQFTTIVSII